MPPMPRPLRAAGLGAVAAVALAVLASAPTAAVPAAPVAPAPAAAPTARPHASLTVTDPRVVAHFDFSKGETPENIALEPDGSADLTFAFAHQVARVDPRGRTRILATLPTEPHPATPLVGAAVTTGIVRTDDGVLYVIYATGTSARNGVWRITPDGGVSRFAALPANGFANGLALDEEHGLLVAADSVLGTVWRIALDDGSVRAWSTAPELRPNGFIGANGIKVHHGAVWVSNFDRGTLLRIPVARDGSAGTLAVRASGLAGVDDFAFTGHDDTVLAALNSSSDLALVHPDGSHTVVLTAEAGLSNPTSVAIRHHRVYVPSAAYTTMHDPNLLIAHLSHARP